MSLLFTGRAVRASRKILISPIEPQRRTSSNAVTSRDPQPPSSPPLRPIIQGYQVPLSQALDIHLEESQPNSDQEDSFQAFLREKKHEPNMILSRGAESGVLISSTPYTLDSTSNLSPNILKLLGRRLYSEANHPISITRKLVESVFPKPTYQNYYASHPVVTTAANFDVLGFPPDHPGRSTTDTYYVNKDKVLRTHTSAHQHAAFAAMKHLPSAHGYTICADVFRRDSIDRSHFPVFHQMEGARLWRKPQTDSQGFKLSSFQAMKQRRETIKKNLQDLGRTPVEAEDPNPSFHDDRNPKQSEHDHQEVRLLAAHLKRSLEFLVAKIFHAANESRIVCSSSSSSSGDTKASAKDAPLKIRWVEAYFPFTSPSWELEVFWQGEWLELLGCGIVQQQMLRNAGIGDRIGWAWGLGVERVAMLLFGIPDIRLFWSEDARFRHQFHRDAITRYEPFSKHPSCYKDVAFWIDGGSPAAAAAATATAAAAAAGGDSTKASPAAKLHPAAFHENDVMEIVRDVAGSLAEDVKLVDEFVQPKSGRKSLCYRINYRSLERTLTNEETNRLHDELCARLERDLGVELR